MKFYFGLKHPNMTTTKRGGVWVCKWLCSKVNVFFYFPELLSFFLEMHFCFLRLPFYFLEIPFYFSKMSCGFPEYHFSIYFCRNSFLFFQCLIYFVYFFFSENAFSQLDVPCCPYDSRLERYYLSSSCFFFLLKLFIDQLMIPSW